MRSIAPVTATTQPAFAARERMKAADSARFSSVTASSGFASTPRVAAAAPATALTSLMLPRKSVTGSSSRSALAVSVRRSEAPAPTGSSRILWPSSPATLPAACIPSMERLFRVPMFKSRPPQMRVIWAASAGSSLMMGLPPMAKSALAQSLTVT